MRSFTNLPSTMSPFLAAGLASAVGVVAMSIRAFESEGAKAKRLELKKAEGTPVTHGQDFGLCPRRSSTIPDWRRGCQRAGPCRAVTEADGHGRYGTQSVAERTESPESSLEWILEIECLKPSVAVCAT